MYHLPNKNWRRIGHYNNLTHCDGTEPVPDYGDTENVLLTAMEYHIALQRRIRMIVERGVDGVNCANFTNTDMI